MLGERLQLIKSWSGVYGSRNVFTISASCLQRVRHPHPKVRPSLRAHWCSNSCGIHPLGNEGSALFPNSTKPCIMGHWISRVKRAEFSSIPSFHQPRILCFPKEGKSAFSRNKCCNTTAAGTQHSKAWELCVSLACNFCYACSLRQVSSQSGMNLAHLHEYQKIYVSHNKKLALFLESYHTVVLIDHTHKGIALNVSSRGIPWTLIRLTTERANYEFAFKHVSAAFTFIFCSWQVSLLAGSLP